MPNDFLFNVEEPWKEHWQNMPEFSQADLMPFKSITVHFRCQADVDEFLRINEQSKPPAGNLGIWFPEEQRGRFSSLRYGDEP